MGQTPPSRSGCCSQGKFLPDTETVNCTAGTERGSRTAYPQAVCVSLSVWRIQCFVRWQKLSILNTPKLMTDIHKCGVLKVRGFRGWVGGLLHDDDNDSDTHVHDSIRPS